MATYISKLIVLVILLIKSLTIVIPDFSVPLMITAGGILAFAAVMLFMGKRKSFSSAIPWILASGILVFCVLPEGPFDPERLTWVPEYLGYLLERMAFDGGRGIWAMIILAVMQLLLRKKENEALIILRYLAAWVMVSAVRDAMFPVPESYYHHTFTVIVSCCCARELISCVHGAFKPSMRRCMSLIAFCVFSRVLFGNWAAEEINNLFLMNDAYSGRSLLLMLVFAGLTLLEDYNDEGLWSDEIYRVRNTGWMMLFWCILAVIMRIWPVFANETILLAGYPLACYVCSKLLDGLDEKDPDNWAVVMFACMTAMLLVLIMLAKSSNLGLLLRWVLLALVMVVLVCWKGILRANVRRGLVETGVGCFAIVMQLTVKFTAWEQLSEDPRQLMGAVLACAIWALICSQLRRLERNTSAVYPLEFRPATTMSRILPVVVLVIASVKVLLA